VLWGISGKMGEKSGDQKTKQKIDKNLYDSGVMRVARGGSGAKAPALAARPQVAHCMCLFVLYCCRMYISMCVVRVDTHSNTYALATSLTAEPMCVNSCAAK